MASNRRTPRSVQHAPKAERIFIHETRGMNRAERRAGGREVVVNEEGKKERLFFHVKRPNLYLRRFLGWSSAERYPTDNEPYRKSAE